MARRKKHDGPLCRWTHDEFTDSWDTDCGEKFQFTVGTPRENGMEFCCYCGRPLQEKAEA